MGYPLRWIKAGQLYETTSRSMHSRLLLRPSEELNTMVRGIIARGVRKYGVKVSYFITMSNHLHILVVPQSARQMKRFMNFVNSNIAKEAGRLHGWREKFWGRRYRLVPVTNEPKAQVARLRYLLAHGCKENLVRKPSEWPGASALKALLNGVAVVGHWFNRTEAYRAKRRGEKVGPWDHAEKESFELAPLPCWANLSAEERKEKARDLVREIEKETSERLAKEGKSPLGARRIMNQHPHSEPRSTKRSPAPLVHADSPEEWITYKRTWLYFVDCYREAANRLKKGDLTVIFPEGSIPPRLPRLGLAGNRRRRPFRAPSPQLVEGLA